MTDHTEAIGRELVALIRGTKDLYHVVRPSGDGPVVEPAAYGLLARLDDLGPMRLSALAARLYLDLSTISRQAAELEQHGWVVRERDPQDGRAYLVGLTPAGKQVLEAGRRQRGAALRRLLADWTDDQRQTFASELARFNQAVEHLRADCRQENVS